MQREGRPSTLLQTCQLTEYCEAATGTCKTKVCTANMPACNGRVVTTCNADGSGFLVGGTDCSPKYCSAGACVDYLFHEDFEDGNVDGLDARYPVLPYASGSQYDGSCRNHEQPLPGQEHHLQLLRWPLPDLR